MRTFLKYFLCGYLGFALSVFYEATVQSWGFWAILAPVIVITIIRDEIK